MNEKSHEELLLKVLRHPNAPFIFEATFNDLTLVEQDHLGVQFCDILAERGHEAERPDHEATLTNHIKTLIHHIDRLFTRIDAIHDSYKVAPEDFELREDLDAELVMLNEQLTHLHLEITDANEYTEDTIKDLQKIEIDIE
jgi:hypothetical protein